MKICLISINKGHVNEDESMLKGLVIWLTNKVESNGE